jgi:hypothetical protein
MAKKYGSKIDLMAVTFTNIFHSRLITIFAQTVFFALKIHIPSCIPAILASRVARFFSVQTYQSWKNIPNDHKLYQTAINYTKWPKIFQRVIKFKNIFHSKALQILPKLGFLV